MLTVRPLRSGNLAVEGPGRRQVAIVDPQSKRVLWSAPGADLAVVRRVCRTWR